MARTYNVIDADGHVLEPVYLFDTYMDPAYRDRAPRLFVDTDGKERLLVEGRKLGSPKGLGLLGAIGARQGTVSDTMKYVEGVVTGPSGTSRAERFLVDSGAKYSLLPPTDWRAIGLAPKRRMTFEWSRPGLSPVAFRPTIGQNLTIPTLSPLPRARPGP